MITTSPWPLRKKDYVPPAQGFVEVYKRFEDDSTELVDVGQNIVVNTGKLIILQSLYPTSNADPLSYAKVGIGGATDAGGLVLKSPSAAQTDLYQPIATLPITKLSQNNATPSITMLASLDNLQGNGYTINEAGFFSGNDLLFSIKTFTGVAKERTFSIDIVWTFRF